MTLDEAIETVDAVGTVVPKALDGGRLAVALPLVAEHIRNTRTGLSMAGVDGAPDWIGYEVALWKLSERLRPVLLARKDWRSGSDLLNALALICKEHRYGKGRQNIALMLGEFGGASEATALGTLLNDQDIQGHVIKALTKLRDRSYQADVERILPQLAGWSKAAAKKYLALQGT